MLQVLKAFVPNDEVDSVKVFLDEEQVAFMSLRNFTEEFKPPYWGHLLISLESFVGKGTEALNLKVMVHQMRILMRDDLLPDYVPRKMTYQTLGDEAGTLV